MAKDLARRFKDFKIRHQLTNQEIRKIVLDYANSDLEYARTYFTNEYEISEHVFYRCRDFSVICCLVDEVTCNKLRKKAAENYKRNNEKESAAQSLKHHTDMMRQRKNFLMSFSDNDIVEMAEKYVDGFEISKIAITYDIDGLAVKYLLRKGITELILDKSSVIAIQKRLGPKLNNILKARERNKAQLLECISAEIDFYQFRLEHPGLYERISEQKISTQEISKKLAHARELYKEASQL